jgi:hypothetical protein
MAFSILAPQWACILVDGKENALMNNSIRWAVLVGALLLASAVGFWAYQAGVAQGIEQSGKIVVPAPGAYPSQYPPPYPPPYPYYGWHRPWGFGFFFGPLFFLAFWLIVVRGLFWRRRYGYGGGCGPRGRRDHFEEWHRQAHARENDARAAGTAGEL